MCEGIAGKDRLALVDLNGNEFGADGVEEIMDMMKESRYGGKIVLSMQQSMSLQCSGTGRTLFPHFSRKYYRLNSAVCKWDHYGSIPFHILNCLLDPCTCINISERGTSTILQQVDFAYTH